MWRGIADWLRFGRLEHLLCPGRALELIEAEAEGRVGGQGGVPRSPPKCGEHDGVQGVQAPQSRLTSGR